MADPCVFCQCPRVNDHERRWFPQVHRVNSIATILHSVVSHPGQNSSLRLDATVLLLSSSPELAALVKAPDRSANPLFN